MNNIEAASKLFRGKLDCLERELDLLNKRLDHVLPKTDFNLKGTIIFKFIKCGKKGCICNNGIDLHGPYPHLQWYNKETGGTKLKYLNRKIFPEIEKHIINNKKYKELNKEKTNLLKEIDNFKKKINELKEKNQYY